MLAVSTSNMLVFVSLLCIVVGNPVLNETESRDARQILFRYRVPWSAPVSLFNDGSSDGDYQDENNEENLINLLSSDAVKWMKNLNPDERDRLTSWTLASAAVTKLMQEKKPAPVPFDRSGSFPYNGAIPLNRYSNYGFVRTPYEPLLSSSAESRTFFLIQQVVQNVATSIQQCQGGVFSLLISRCQQPRNTTTTTKATTTGAGTTATTTTAGTETTGTGATATVMAPMGGK